MILDTYKKVDVLIVSDDTHALEPVKKGFKNSLFHLHLYKTEKEGLGFLKVKTPSIVIGGENFLPFLKKAKKLLPQSVRLFLSEEYHLDTIKKAINQGDVYRVVSSSSDFFQLKNTLEETWGYYCILEENRKLIRKAEEQSLALDKTICSIEKNIEERTNLLEESRLEISQTQAELEALNKFMKHISMAMSIEEVSEWAEKELKKILDFEKLILFVGTHKKPALDHLNEFTVALPLVYRERLLGHFYLKGKDESLLKQGQKYLGFLQQVSNTIALTVDRIESFRKASRNKRAWEASFDAIVDPVAVLDHQYRVIRANAAYSKVCGVKLTELSGKKCFEVFEGRNTFCEGCYIKEAFSANQGVMSDISSEKQNKKYKATSYPVFNHEGGVKFIVQYYKDVTRELSYQDQLVRAEKTAELGILAGSIAHEINNPLGGILAFSQIMKSELKKEDSLYADAVDIEDAALRCKKIIENLLNFARQSRESEKSAHIVQDILNMSISLIEFQAKHFNIEFSKKISSKPIRVYGNFNQLWQVLVNILENAIEVVLEKKKGLKKIKITVGVSGKRVKICMINNGKIIPQKEIAKIFSPLYTTKDPDKNPGLGLSMSQSIIKDHGGELRVGLNRRKETVFTVFLPIFRTKN